MENWREYLASKSRNVVSEVSGENFDYSMLAERLEVRLLLGQRGVYGGSIDFLSTSQWTERGWELRAVVPVEAE